MGVKEKAVGALQSKDLAWHAEFERSIDRLTALGMCDKLGSALWRFKYCNDPEAHKTALALLMEKANVRVRLNLQDPFQWQYLMQITVGVIREWTLDACNRCLGTATISGLNGVRCSCPNCKGMGVKIYSEADHMRNCKLSAWNRGHEKIFDTVMECLSGSTAAVGGQMRQLLPKAEL